LQAYDPDAAGCGILVSGGLAMLPGGHVGARLLLLLGASRMALFIGHARWSGELAVPELRLTSHARRLALSFHGAMLCCDDGAGYFADERIQAQARLVDATVALELERAGASGDGTASGDGLVTGQVVLADLRASFSARGFTGPGLARASSAGGGPRTRLLASFERGDALALDLRDGNDGAAVFLRPGEPAPSFRVALADGGSMLWEPRGRLAVLRGAGSGRHALVTFGPARFHCARRGSGSGLYEHVRHLEETP
jgi:hypothetical protein